MFKQNRWRFCSTALTVFCLYSAPALAQNTLESIQETGVLSLAIREDAAPFGYVDSNEQLRGYCLDFFALLEEKLTEYLPRNTLSTRLVKSTVGNRFELVDKGVIDIECGPNTIRELSLSNVGFSRPFFIANTQFLTTEASNFELNSNLSEVTIGVIANTTTEQLVRERYPNAKLVLYSGITARSRGVQAVAQGRIDAMVSDGILLRAEAARQSLSVEEFILIPTITEVFDDELLSRRDRYGMIIPANDTLWENFVNSVIESPESQQLLRSWFQDNVELLELEPQNSTPETESTNSELPHKK